MSLLENKYWGARSSSIYLYTVRELVTHLAKEAQSLIDVGSAGCPYLDWYDWIPNRTSLDMDLPYVSAGIDSVKSNFLKWSKDRDYDVCTCLQVLEHVPQVEDFAQKLLETANVLIVSVPYKWTYGNNKSHVHDPVDEIKMLSWFGKPPNFSIIVREVFTDSRRLVNVYERGDFSKWSSLRHRDRQKA